MLSESYAITHWSSVEVSDLRYLLGPLLWLVVMLKGGLRLLTPRGHLFFFVFLCVAPLLTLAAAAAGEERVLNWPWVQLLNGILNVVEVISFFALLGTAIVKQSPLAAVAAIMVIGLASFGAEAGGFAAFWTNVVSAALGFEELILEAANPNGRDLKARFFR